jgi:hypothetical protein
MERRILDILLGLVLIRFADCVNMLASGESGKYPNSDSAYYKNYDGSHGRCIVPD